MSSIPSRAAHSVPLRKRFGFVAFPALALVAATCIAGCTGDSGNEGQPDTERSHSTEAKPLGAGELIVFEHPVPGAEERDLYVVGPDGGEPWLLRSPGDYPQWSPDGSQLAFLACLNPPDCTTAVALLERSTGEVHGLSMPDPDLFTPCAEWAPSGRELACEGTSESDPTRNGVYTIRASDGKELTRITRNPAGGIDHPLAYSPDGSRLLLSREDPSRGGSALFITPITGGQPHRITPWGYADDYASWSPDGRTIVFGTNGLLYRVSPEGRGLAEITLEMPDGSSAETAFDVAFSPDGQNIVFSLGSPAPGIYLARLDGSDVERLTTGEDHHANWGAASGP
jgi:Tol biopolymer transport system component